MANKSPKDYDRWGGVTNVKVIKSPDKKETNSPTKKPKPTKK